MRGLPIRLIAVWVIACATAQVAASEVPLVMRPTREVMPWEAGLTDTVETAQEQSDIEMFVGETRVLAAPGVARVAIGNGRVINATTADDREVIVFGNAPGESSLVIWNETGENRHVRITVVAGQNRRTHQELASFLTRIPNARSVVIGDKIIIEGEDLSDADQAKIALLAKRYPQIVDFTGQIGWERMVLMDVKVVEIPRSRMKELGIRWDTGTTGGINAGIAWDAAAGSRLRSVAEIEARPGESPILAPFPASSPTGYLGINALLSARLNAMSQAGDVVILAEPQLSARSGSTASFLAGGEVPYSTTDRNGATNTAFKPYGVTLQITPRVDRTGTIRSVIDVEVSTVDASVVTTGGPALKVRRTSTEFNVRPAQTLVLSGFISREQSEEVNGVPGLSRLPLVGALFRSRSTRRLDTELVIFVTPVVVTPDNPEMQERVRRSQRLLDQTFGEPRLNVPIHPDVFFTEP